MLNTTEKLHFRVSSGLKNIIGRELVNDKYIAIFELVKNSYDAGAKNVYIKFIDIYSDNAKISIIDDGSGMNKNDLVNKWLFVAYSEKKKVSYRDSIGRRTLTGAKGIGRFSCDRLGSFLCMMSKKNDESLLNRMIVNWDDFDISDEDDFVNIDIIHENIINNDAIKNNGTIIEIQNLREKWTVEDLLKLKISLTKLINPNATDVYDDFKIFLEVPDEIENDKRNKYDREKLNGQIENYIFELLDIKTTMINVEISEDGQTIETVMSDRGTYLFKIVEKNPYSLKNIKCSIYNLNRAAKLNFHKIMGVRPVNYGTVFVYKNGFRIYPYGESGEDFFNIDKRKAQGHNRYIGTREIVGNMQILGENNDFTETSSRNDGFIKNRQYYELIEFFYDFVLRPLEKYVVNIMKWSEPYTIEGREFESIQPNEIEDLEIVVKKIKSNLRSSNILYINYNKDLIKISLNHKSCGMGYS